MPVQQTYRHRLSYTLCFELRIAHDFYRDGRCRDFEIAPTPETAARLRNHHLVFRPEADGFVLARDDAKDYSNEVFLRPEAFEFTLRNTNPDFVRFTELPYQSGQFHLFDTASAVEGRLHPGVHVDASTLQEGDVDGFTAVVRVRHLPERPLWEGDASVCRLAFTARKARVRYVFYGNPEYLKNIDGYFVENFDNYNKSFKFTSPFAVTMRNGAPGFEMSTEDEVDLRERFEWQWVLRRKARVGVPFEFRKVLPKPRADAVHYDDVKKGFIPQLFIKL